MFSADTLITTQTWVLPKIIPIFVFLQPVFHLSPPDWFRDNADLLPALAAKRSAWLKVMAWNSLSAHMELPAAKRTVQLLTRFVVSRYWENLSISIYSTPAHVSRSASSNLQQLPVLNELHSPFHHERCPTCNQRSQEQEVPWTRWHSTRDSQKWWQTSANGALSHSHKLLAGVEDVFRTISETPTSLISTRTRAVVATVATIVASRLCVLPGKFLLVSSSQSSSDCWQNSPWESVWLSPV